MKKNHLPAKDDFSKALSELCSRYSRKSLTGEIRPGSFATQKKQIILIHKTDEMSGILTDLAIHA
jgi:hypothetical protein